MKIIFIFFTNLIPFLYYTQNTNLKFRSINQNAEIMDYSQTDNFSSHNNLDARISCSQQYIAGRSQTFTLTINYMGFETIDSLKITFPYGFIISSAFHNTPLDINETLVIVQSNCSNKEISKLEHHKGVQVQSMIWTRNKYSSKLSEANCTATISISATIDKDVTGPKPLSFHVFGNSYECLPVDFDDKFIIYDSRTNLNHDFQASSVFIWNTRSVFIWNTRQDKNLTNKSDYGVRTIYSRIKNVGNTIEPYVTASYSVNGIIIGPFYVPETFHNGVEHIIRFPIQCDLGTNGIYNIKAWANISEDSNHNNDTAYFTINANPIPMRFGY